MFTNQSELISHYFPEINSVQQEQFAALFEIYSFWNQKINLISRQDIDQLYLKHILHSLAIAKFIQFQANTKIVDIGTGGGFPGIPLAIMFPDSQFTLVDSIGKKIKALSEIMKTLQLKNSTAIQDRIENLSLNPHFYTCRAVAPFSEIVNWIGKKIDSNNFNSKPNGLLALKGGDLKDELSAYKQAKIIPISNFFQEEFFSTKYIAYSPIA